MSFFQETKNAGVLLLIIGIIGLIAAIVSLFMVVDGTSISFSTDIKLAGILSCVGGVIAALIFAVLGLDIMKGSCRLQVGNLFSDVDSKYGVLTAIIAADGIGSLITGILMLFSGSDIGSYIGTIVIALIMVLIAYVMSNGSAGKIIWIIVLIISIIAVIVYLISIIAIVTIPSLLLAIMILVFVLSPEVKEKMS